MTRTATTPRPYRSTPLAIGDRVRHEFVAFGPSADIEGVIVGITAAGEALWLPDGATRRRPLVLAPGVRVRAI